MADAEENAIVELKKTDDCDNYFIEYSKEQPGVLIVCDFFATWCSPCKKLAQRIKEMSKKYKYLQCRFFKVDVEICTLLAEAEEISAMPTVVFYKNGEKLDTVIGANSEKVESLIKEFIV